MFKSLSSLFVAFLFISCSVEKRTQTSYDWIKTHKKPIVVKLRSINNELFVYILIDKDSNVYYTGEINSILPDIIN